MIMELTQRSQARQDLLCTIHIGHEEHGATLVLMTAQGSLGLSSARQRDCYFKRCAPADHCAMCARCSWRRPTALLYTVSGTPHRTARLHKDTVRSRRPYPRIAPRGFLAERRIHYLLVLQAVPVGAARRRARTAMLREAAPSTAAPPKSAPGPQRSSARPAHTVPTARPSVKVSEVSAWRRD